jgi:hypothetical protein
MSDLLRHFYGLSDVPLLRGFVAATKQDDKGRATSHEINAISGAVIDPKLGDSVKEFHVTKKTRLDTHDPLDDPLGGADIGQTLEPSLKFSGLANLDHL